MPRQKVDADTLIQHALRLFKTQGYHAASMADVGEACGLLKGSIYHCFPSKEALALAVMGHVQAYFASRVFAHADDAPLSLLARLQGLNRASVPPCLRCQLSNPSVWRGWKDSWPLRRLPCLGIPCRSPCCSARPMTPRRLTCRRVRNWPGRMCCCRSRPGRNSRRTNKKGAASALFICLPDGVRISALP